MGTLCPKDRFFSAEGFLKNRSGKSPDTGSCAPSDGANPCNHCQRNESLCEYNIRRSRQHQRTKSIQSLDKDVSTSAQPHATNGSTMPDSSDPDHSPGVVVGQDTQGSANPLNTPFSESYFSQLVSDSAHSYVDLDFPDEMMASTDQVQIIVEAAVPPTAERMVDERIEPCQQMSSSQNEMPYYVSRNDTPMMDWLKLGCDQIPHQHSTAQLCDLLGTEADSSGGGCTLALFSERIVADKAEVNDLSLFIDRSSLMFNAAKTRPFSTMQIEGAGYNRQY
ncbi:hypothetical protein SNOG_02572 [Parastagonospora nodorum SN15]|uniref:Zn(2)-C6 fungal-type domain-containing protein n=1 Tax=Phaeosphaeria nodorum (strain SN15 / ATCC MYA-4574 / FGSC 10173) TaxID=321614 RepID=Q0V092_PHANO|nr:hypothetical protein SNOG_02572 [Parastagonospora nodorum SN15]EAT89303.1 hypothetical protein SNOG_02572 [Parastagonospora nodorum SN15]